MKQKPPVPSPRVLIVCPFWSSQYGGISRVVGYLTNAWQGQDDAPDYRVVDTRGPGSLMWSPFYLVRAVAVLVREFATGRASLLHINISSKGSTLRKAVIVLVAVLVHAPYILHLHSGKFHLFFRKLPRPLKAVVRGMFYRAIRVIVLGTKWRDFVCDEIGVDPGRVVIMHNAVSAPAPFQRKPSSGPCRILFLGRLGTNKGVPELLQSFALKCVQSLEWTAILVGDGDVEHYRKMAADLGLNERVEIPGWVGPEAVSTYLNSADILVQPSHNEGLPLSVLEGMAHGLAIVATPVGAIAEAIDDGVSGLLVPPGNIDALADALAQVVEDAGLRRSLSRAARKSFAERFDMRKYAQRMAMLYRLCVAEREGSTGHEGSEHM